MAATVIQLHLVSTRRSGTQLTVWLRAVLSPHAHSQRHNVLMHLAATCNCLGPALHAHTQLYLCPGIMRS